MESPHSRPLALIGRAAALGVGYACLYKLVVLGTSFGSSIGATFWPGAALTVAVLLRRPRHEWPALLAAVAAAEAGLDLSEGFGVPLSLAWALANTAEPALGAFLLTRAIGGPPDLSRRDHLGRFALYAVFIGPLLGALIGTAAAVAFAGDPWWPRLPRWLVGDGIAVLVLTPLLLCRLDAIRCLAHRSAAMPMAVLAVVVGVALGPFGFSGEIGLPFLVLPVLAVVAGVLRTPGAALGSFLVGIWVEALAATGHGPFAETGAFEGLVVAQLFLVMTTSTALTIAALMTDLVSRDDVEAKLRDQALRDSLTGLANRRLALDRLHMAAHRLGRHEGILTVMFVDLDGFKDINDRHGHGAGDAVLVGVARRLETCVRAEDTVARLGGDEFLVISEGVAADGDVEALTARVTAALEAPVPWRGDALAIGASIGVVTAHEPGETAESLLARADGAMYEAKRDGGRRRARAVALAPGG